MANRILCFGDSNTYGYDPRGAFGGRYPASGRWPELLAAAGLGEVVNAGQNGREIPHSARALQSLDELLRAGPLPDLLIVMLGTNDLLMMYFPTAEAAAARMEVLLAHLQKAFPGLSILLLAPPPVALPDPDLVQASRKLAAAYAALADRLPVSFADTGRWGLLLAFDGVHFTEEGHRIFARQLALALRAL